MKETRFWLMIKYALTIFMAVLVPVYWHHYGPLNFLWISDMGLILTTVGLWLRAPVLVSMAAVGVMLTELVWCVDYFAELLFGLNIIDLSDYMFDGGYPVLLRGLSLFHVAMPIIWILYLKQYGYHTRALRYMTFLYWAMVIFTYTLTEPAANVNWVFLPLFRPHWGVAENVWMILLMVLFPLGIFLPTHYAYTKLFKTTS